MSKYTILVYPIAIIISTYCVDEDTSFLSSYSTTPGTSIIR